MGKWKDEDLATIAFIKEYLAEFKSGIEGNPQFLLNDREKNKVQSAIVATEAFCLELLGTRKNKLYMHDMILMAVGFYGGYLSASDVQTRHSQPNPGNN
jgi:hypothetical protein